MEFETLFSDDNNIKDLRNELLPDFFMDLNDLYWENFLMTIARLLDSYKQGQNYNFTLFTLVQILKEAGLQIPVPTNRNWIRGWSDRTR